MKKKQLETENFLRHPVPKALYEWLRRTIGRVPSPRREGNMLYEHADSTELSRLTTLSFRAEEKIFMEGRAVWPEYY